MSYRHADTDRDGDCLPCTEDDEPLPPHEAGLAGEDQEGAFCWCGHAVLREGDADAVEH